MQKQDLLYAHCKPAGTSSVQQQQQEEVPRPSRKLYLKAKPRKVTLAGCGVTGSILIGSCLGTFQKFYFELHLLLVECSYWLRKFCGYLYFPDDFPVTFAPSHFRGLECLTGNSVHKTQDGGGGQDGGVLVLHLDIKPQRLPVLKIQAKVASGSRPAFEVGNTV